MAKRIPDPLTDFIYHPGAEKFHYPGPPAVLTCPPIEQAVEAELALNNGAVTAAQAETLLGWIVYRTRVAMTNPECLPLESEDARDFYLNASLSQSCGLSQGAVGFQAELLGIEHHYHQINQLTLYDSFQHTFGTVALPVIQEDGSVANKEFLVDVTFRQFCHLEIVNEKRNWGAELIQTPEGKNLTDELLSKGYAELTPETAQLYVGSANRKSDGKCDEKPIPELTQTLRIDTSNNDYGLEEFVRFRTDLRPPVMTSENKPLHGMLALHEERMAKPEPVIAAEEMAVQDGKLRGGQRGREE